MKKPSILSCVLLLAIALLAPGCKKKEDASDIDRFLADQLLIYMAISKAGSCTTNELSTHLRTNMEITKKFLDVNFCVEYCEQIYKVSCHSS